MEFGNVYEVFQLEDRVKVIEPRVVYYGRTGTIVQIEDISYNTEPIYTVRLDEPYSPFFDQVKHHDIKVNAKGIEKILRREAEEETIVMGLRSGKTYLTQIGKFTNKDNGFDSVIYEMEKQRKFAERGVDDMKKIDVEKIIFNNFKTIVFWNDGTKTIVSMSQEERNFDPEDAFRAAYTKKMYGTNGKIKRVIKEKSNIEQHQRIVEEKLKEELAKISQDYDKFMRELCPWLYTGKDDECLGKSCPCGDLENTKAEMEDKDGND